MAKIRTKMPSKVGKVGRHKLPVSDKKQRLDVWKEAGKIEALGGKKALESEISEFIEKKYLLINI